MYKYVYAVLCLFCSIYSNAQTRNFPKFPNPQNDFYKLLEEDKILNPVYLKGAVRDVNRTHTLHISPDNEEEYMTNYFYRLNRAKEITEYITNDRYDNTTIAYLNKALQPAIQHDTIIKEDDFETYRYQKGKLTQYMAYDTYGMITDSIVYTYKNDQLLTRTHYSSEIFIDIAFSDNGDVEQSILYADLEIYAYDKATYTEKGQIKALTQYKFIEGDDYVDTYNYRYSYDAKGRFERMKMISNQYVPTRENLKKGPEKWKFEKNKMIEGTYLEITINTTYDTKNRILTYLKTDSQKNKEFYNISYGEDYNKVIVVDRDDYNTYNNTSIHRDLVYEYSYDMYHNPTEITSYIVVDGKKILDKSTRLQISYY
ncbi:hypothetical protein ACFO3O_00400 [Dokdonia ponticola]|uniref:DUF4595 domain-containing protein n=1 Tax=Dokdonia ponticola TaxID=2041041 RepID=A0ABV9HQ82_9FLAO